MNNENDELPGYMFNTAEMIIRVAENLDQERAGILISEFLSDRRIYVAGAEDPGLLQRHLRCG